MYTVRIKRGSEWHSVGEYPTKAMAEAIARDYRSQGEIAKIVDDEQWDCEMRKERRQS